MSDSNTIGQATVAAKTTIISFTDQLGTTNERLDQHIQALSIIIQRLDGNPPQAQTSDDQSSNPGELGALEDNIRQTDGLVIELEKLILLAQRL